jgi:hypothetical protein
LGSPSIIATCAPIVASSLARISAVVLFPEPPLGLKTEIIGKADLPLFHALLKSAAFYGIETPNGLTTYNSLRSFSHVQKVKRVHLV